MKPVICIFASLIAMPALAADDERSDVTVHEGENITITEHHPKDMRERVEVAPRKGRPYVLLDSDNNGSLDRNTGSPSRNDGLMMWSIGKW